MNLSHHANLRQQDLERFRAALQRAGLKLTPQRLAVVEILAGCASHPTAQEIHQELQARFPTIAVATVYNTLSSLTAIGACRPLELDGPTRFDPKMELHHHAVCDRCGSVRDVQARRERAPSPPLPGFAVDRIEKIFRGVCAKCSRRDG